MSRLGALHLTKYTGAKHTATVIFFHGSALQTGCRPNYDGESLPLPMDISNTRATVNMLPASKAADARTQLKVGSNGADMQEWVRLMVKNFSFPHIKVVYPTAPLQPYTPVGGMMSNVWFDRADISPDAPEKLDSLARIENEVKNLIKKEHHDGIVSSRIIVGGFSMGGSLAFHTAYRWDSNIAGAFVFSSFLNQNSIVYKEIKNHSGEKYPPLLQIHGDADDLVHFEWGQTTFQQMQALGIQGEFHVMERLGHSINKRGMSLIKEWIEKRLPDV